MFYWLKKMFGLSEPKRRRRRHPAPEPEIRLAKLPPRRAEAEITTTATPTPQTCTGSSSLRAVPGALTYQEKHSGQVIYNLLTPHMKQFMGRCIGAVKRAGIAAKGTGQFSVLVGDSGHELDLTGFYQPSDDPALIEKVVAEARRVTNAA